MNEACGLLPPPFSSCIPRALASTLFPLPSPTTPFPAVSSLSRSPSLSPLTTLSPTTRLGVYATCACVRALPPIPLHRRGQQCSNVRVSIFLRFTGCTDYTRRAATGIYTGIIRETAATSRHGSAGRRIKSTGRSSVSGTANPIETVFQPTTSNVIATQGWSVSVPN